MTYISYIYLFSLLPSAVIEEMFIYYMRQSYNNLLDLFVLLFTVELLTPQHWYNTCAEAPAGSVIKGHSFNITCSTLQQYPGGSFQLRLTRSNGTVRHSLPALTPFVTFTFPNAQTSNEGYYYCLYRVQLGGRIFVSRESQPLPIAIRGECDNIERMNSIICVCACVLITEFCHNNICILLLL